MTTMPTPTNPVANLPPVCTLAEGRYTTNNLVSRSERAAAQD